MRRPQGLYVAGKGAEDLRACWLMELPVGGANTVHPTYRSTVGSGGVREEAPEDRMSWGAPLTVRRLNRKGVL